MKGRYKSRMTFKRVCKALGLTSRERVLLVRRYKIKLKERSVNTKGEESP